MTPDLCDLVPQVTLVWQYLSISQIWRKCLHWWPRYAENPNLRWRSPSRRILLKVSLWFTASVTVVYQYLFAYQIWWNYGHWRSKYHRKSKFNRAAVLNFIKKLLFRAPSGPHMAIFIRKPNLVQIGQQVVEIHYLCISKMAVVRHFGYVIPCFRPLTTSPLPGCIFAVNGIMIRSDWSRYFDFTSLLIWLQNVNSRPLVGGFFG